MLLPAEFTSVSYTHLDIHVHIPEGAVPKDGPSAGITMAVAMLSAITEKKVRADLAMTGEVTLRGRVLPIGGLKEKLLAAKSAGIKTVLVPKANQADVEELSAEITKGMEILFVESMEMCIRDRDLTVHRSCTRRRLQTDMLRQEEGWERRFHLL